jgi:uncharacterized protein (DUF2267 family)
MTTIPAFDSALRTSLDWLEDFRSRLGWQDAERALLALVATLHALRDHLPTQEAARLGAALPILLRGFYFEAWHPRPAAPASSREGFFSRIHEGVHRDAAADPEAISRASLALLAGRMPAAEVEEIRAATPAQLHGLWPD